jgi:hypothetical protein
MGTATTYGALDGVFLGFAGLLARAEGLLAGAGDFALTGAGDLPRTREVDALGALGEDVLGARGLVGAASAPVSASFESLPRKFFCCLTAHGFIRRVLCCNHKQFTNINAIHTT